MEESFRQNLRVGNREGRDPHVILGSIKRGNICAVRWVSAPIQAGVRPVLYILKHINSSFFSGIDKLAHKKLLRVQVSIFKIFLKSQNIIYQRQKENAITYFCTNKILLM